MATTDIENPAENSTPQTAPIPIQTGKRPRGRPRKVETPAIETETQADPLSDPFRFFLPKLSAADWQNHLIYLYRLAPITDRRASTGRAVYVAKYSCPIDEDYILKDPSCGSGRYRAELVQSPTDGGDNVYIFRYTFDVMNPDYPPRIPPGEWLDDPRNADWAWAKPKLQAAAGATGNTAGEIAGAVRDLLREVKPELGNEERTSLASQVAQLAKDNQALIRELSDPKKQFDTLTSLLNLVPKPAPDTKMDLFMQMLMEDRKAMRETIDRLQQQVMAKNNKSFIEELTEFASAKDNVKNLFGFSERAPRESSDSLWADVVRDTVTELAPVARQIAEGFFMSRARGWQPPGQQNGAPRLQPATAPMNAAQRRATARTAGRGDTVPAAAQPQQQQTQQPAPAADSLPGASDTFNALSQEEKGAVMQLWQKYGQLIQDCIPFLYDMYTAGLSGYDFRDWFISRKGLTYWNGLRSEVGTKNLVNFAKFDGELWKHLQPEEKLTKFFDEFFTEQGNEPAGWDDEDEEPAPTDPAQNDAGSRKRQQP